MKGAEPAAVGAALAWGRETLAAALADTPHEPGFEAELLLAATAGVSRAQLRATPERALTPAQLATYGDWIARRAGGEPVAYLLGRRGFRELELEVTPAVLVPRPETELLVDWALAVLPPPPAPAAVLDLGTGSGALGLALACERPGLAVDLVDASAAALAVAARNAARLGLATEPAASPDGVPQAPAATRVPRGSGAVRPALRLLHGDWYQPVAGRYDAIVANPPYLAADDPHLAGPGLAHEPRAALVAGTSGLEDLERIAAGARARLRDGGWLLVEHGATQGAAVRALLAGHGLVEVATRRDLAGLERATGGRRRDPPHAVAPA